MVYNYIPYLTLLNISHFKIHKNNKKELHWGFILFYYIIDIQRIINNTRRNDNYS